VTGETYSDDLPTLNGWDNARNGSWDAFVAKFSADGSLLWSTYLGGSTLDEGRGIAVDGAGNAYVTGLTCSTDFPMLNGWDTTYNGGGDTFVTKFSADGSLLLSTYLGGTHNDSGRGIAVDGAGDTYVTGETGSRDFPTGFGWDSTYNEGDYDGDAFVTKFSADGALLWSTYLGGSDSDWGSGIAADGAGNAYVTGFAGSYDFPAGKSWDTTSNGCADAFVAKLTYVPRTLNVRSSPWTGFRITGTAPGRTNYSSVLDDASAVVLRTVALSTQGYVFVRWDLNGTAKTCGDTTLRFIIHRDSTAAARYKLFRSLKITGPTVVNELGRARYTCKLYCKDGTAYIVTPGAKWLDSSAYARFEKPGCLRTYAVPSSKRVRLSATYAGRTCYVYITIRNTR